MEPITTAALIGAGSNLLGGLFGRSEASKQRKMYRAQMAQAQGQFDSQMDESIQRRVKDAIAAGVHPLFALGGSVGASPTISGGQPPESGNAMGDAIARAGQNIANSPLMKAQIARDEAEAALMNSQAARNVQALAAEGRDVLGNPGQNGVRTFPLPDQEPMGVATYFSPEIPKHGPNPGITAGVTPGTMNARMPDGRTINVYNPDLGLDEIAQVDAAFQRAVHKGADALMWLRKNGFMVKKPPRLATIHPKVKKRTYSPYWEYRAKQGYNYIRSKF